MEETTRERILSQALRAFAARGYNAVGVQEICIAAGITKPSLYHHFGSKRGLLEAIATERYLPFLAEFEKRTCYRGDVTAALTAALAALLDSARKNPEFARLRLALSFCPPESEERQVMREPDERLMTLTRALFTAAAADHGNMRGRDLPYAASFLGMAGAYVSLLLQGKLDPDTDLTARIIHHYMHGIFS